MTLKRTSKSSIKSNIFGLFIFLQLVLGVGCTTPEMYNSWKGAHVSELVDEWADNNEFYINSTMIA